MYRYLLIPLLLVALNHHAAAQIKLSSELEFTSFVQYEPVMVKVTIGNELGQPAVFNLNEDDPQFYYLVKDENGFILPPRQDVELPHPVMIFPRASETMTNNILKYFSINTPGYYSVQPCVDWRGKTYRGDKKQFEVQEGREISHATGIVPGDGSVRLFRLFHINRDLQDHLLFRIDDEDAHLCYGVFPLGRIIFNAQPEIAVDQKANAHIVYRMSPYTHIYVVFSPMGYREKYEVYGQQYAEVKLISSPDGSITVDSPLDSRRGGGNIPDVRSIIEKNKMRPKKEDQ